MRTSSCILALILVASAAWTAEASTRIRSIGIIAGMGVNYHSMHDVVDRINGTSIGAQRAAEFKSGVEFFGAGSFPLSEDWALKLEYSYLLASYTQSSNFGNAEFSYGVHMPTLVGQYVLYAGESYDFKAGLGFGYHFGTYSEKYSVIDASYKGSGPGALLELEGNTSLGDNIYAHLGTQLRWDFVGDVKDAAGKAPSGNTGAVSLHFFSVGARLGFTVQL